MTNFENITRIIEAKKTGDKKLFFYNSKNEKVTTESFVKEFYELQGYKVMRAEVNFWQAMFCLVFFEEIYSMNVYPMNDIPIDLFQSEFFYQARKNIIDEKYNYIKNCNLPEFINSQILKHGDSKNRLFYMNLPTYKVDNIAYFKTEIVQEFIKKINQNLFCEIVYKIARNPNDNRAGLPDFIIWNNNILEFIEVKRIDEKLRPPQGIWIEYLLSMNTPVYIVRVKDI